MTTASSRTAALLDALPYILRFRGAIFVVKYGGAFMDSPDPAVRAGLAADIVFLAAVGIKPVVVHGGGKAITRALAAAGVGTVFEQGHRVTDQETVAVVDAVLSNEINPEIVRQLEEQSRGDKAIPVRGFAGPDIFRCRKKLMTQAGSKAPIDLGLVGEVVQVNGQPIADCLAAGGIPVVSPTATGADDARIYNCNADTAAAKMAEALHARRLIFMSDVPGVMTDPADPQTLIPVLETSRISQLEAQGVISHGMLPKLDSARRALEAGVGAVSLLDARRPHALLEEIFSERGSGTMVVLAG